MSKSQNFDAWIGKSQSLVSDIDQRQVDLLSVTLDRPSLKAGEVLPHCWHWSWFNEAKPASELGRDGHSKRGGFLPPIELPRRMWAGGSLEFLSPIKIGKKITKRTTIETVAEKNGSTGKLCILTLHHELFDGETLCINEKQNLVYREDPKPNSKPASLIEPPSNAEISRTITPDPVLMFRYSALTFNGHRIHYDVDYARDVEGYPGLVFHAPLTATLLCGLAKELADGTPLKSFNYRATAPLFGHEPFTIHGRKHADGITVWAQTPNGGQAMIGEAGV